LINFPRVLRERFLILIFCILSQNSTVFATSGITRAASIKRTFSGMCTRFAPVSLKTWKTTAGMHIVYTHTRKKGMGRRQCGHRCGTDQSAEKRAPPSLLQRTANPLRWFPICICRADVFRNIIISFCTRFNNRGRVAHFDRPTCRQV